MKGSFFQRHLVEDSFAVAKSWPDQMKLSEGTKPKNAEFEQWTIQLQEQENGTTEVNGVVRENGSAKMDGLVDGFDDNSTVRGMKLRRNRI